jgi:hypothetical protein
MGWFLWFYIILIIVIFLVIFLTVFLTKNPNSKAKAENRATMFLFGFMIFALAVSASYSSIAATGTGGKDASNANKQAHTLYTWATVLAWIGFVLAIVGLVALIYFNVAYPGASALYNKVQGYAGGRGGLVKFCMWAITFLILIVGVLCAVGAAYQGVSDQLTGYRAGIIAAVTSIILFALMISLSVARSVKDSAKETKEKKEKKEKKENALTAEG